GFGDAAGSAFFAGRNKPELDLLYDPSRSAELAMVRGILTEHVMRAVSQEVLSGASGARIVQDTLARLDTLSLSPDDRRALQDLLRSVQTFTSRASPAVAAGGLSLPYRVHEEAVTGRTARPYNGYAHSFAGMGVQFLMFAAVDLGIGILLERQRGLWKRLRSAPISRRLLLGGKTASGSVITVLTLIVSFAFAIGVWGVRIQGRLPGFLIIC